MLIHKEDSIKVSGKAMLGVGFETVWEMSIKYQTSGSGEYTFSTVEGVKADSWPVLSLEIPFQVGQENIVADFFIKLTDFIKENLPQPKTYIGLKQEG